MAEGPELEGVMTHEILTPEDAAFEIVASMGSALPEECRQPLKKAIEDAMTAWGELMAENEAVVAEMRDR